MLERGFVVYSNAAKEELLGVPASMLERHGAVSEETARAMAEGALKASRAGRCGERHRVAGPDGGTAAKPVGSSISPARAPAAQSSRAKSGSATSAATPFAWHRSGSGSISSRRHCRRGR